MALTGTRSIVKDTLKKINRVGLYSLVLWEGLSPFMKELLFGKESLGQAKSTAVNMQNIILSPTTTEDGRTLKWRTLGITRVKTTVSGDVAGSTTITVADPKGFSVGDHIIIKDASGDISTYIVGISGNTFTLSDSVTTSDGTEIVRGSYSKAEGNIIDRNDYEAEYDEYSNYLQDFGAQKTFTLRLLNSHIDIDLGLSDWDKNPRELLKTKKGREQINTAVANYLQLEFARKVGGEILADVEGAFLVGKKKIVTDGGKTRYYTAGLEEVVDTTVINAADSKDKQFQDISNAIYDVINKSSQFNNKRVVMMVNDAFYKTFMTLMSDKVRYTSDVDAAGNVLNKIQFVDGRVVELQYIPRMDYYYSKPTALVIPMDLVGAYRPQYFDVEAQSSGFKAIEGRPDIIIKKQKNYEDTLDTIGFLIYYVLGFIFGGAEMGIYKKLIIQ